MTSLKYKKCTAVYLLFYTLLLIIRRFLVKRFYQQFAESVQRRKLTTPTGIILVILHYTINGSD